MVKLKDIEKQIKKDVIVKVWGQKYADELEKTNIDISDLCTHQLREFADQADLDGINYDEKEEHKKFRKGDGTLQER